MHTLSIPLMAEVHIWSACLTENEDDLSYFSVLLSEDEHQRADGLKFTKDKYAFVISRGILRCLLGRYLKEDPHQIDILYGLWGKPCLSSKYSLRFNLSHSKDYALYAFTVYDEVGIDLEHIDPSLEVEELAQTILSSQEKSYWEKIDPEDKSSAFFKLWVYKEASLKASGRGWLSHQQELLLPILENISQASCPHIENNNITSPHYFEVIPGYASAFYVERSCVRPFYYTWDLHL